MTPTIYLLCCLAILLLLNPSYGIDAEVDEYEDLSGMPSEEEILQILQDAGLNDVEDLEGLDLEDLLNIIMDATDDGDEPIFPDGDWDEGLEAADDWSQSAEMDEDVDPTIMSLSRTLEEMYSSVAHGDSRYFNMMLKQLTNDTYSELLLEHPVMEAIDGMYRHILNTMHLVSEISIKIHADPMQINSMNEGLLIIFKSFNRWMRQDSGYDVVISDDTYRWGPVSFINSLSCEGISLSLQYRLIQPLQFILHDTNNTEQWYCFDMYHNLLDQTLFHLATKSRASGFSRLFFHLPSALPVLKYLHISNKGLMAMINPESPIINQQMIKKRMSDIDVVIILRAAFKLNLPNEWFLRRDIHGKSAFDLWIKRTPHYLRFVYYHSAVSKLFSSHHQHLEGGYDSDTCLSMEFVQTYWASIAWFPVPVHKEIDIENTHSVPEVDNQSEFDNMFPIKWFEQEPIVFRGGMTTKWNLNELSLTELEGLLDKDIFLTSHIPYEDLYESDYIDEEAERLDREERSTNFKDFVDVHFNETIAQSANMEVACTLFAEDETEIPYIFDNAMYWSNQQFEQRFNSSELIPTHIGDLADQLIASYRAKMNLTEDDDEEFEYDRHSVVQSMFLLKQFSVGPMYSGAPPHFHGPSFNALLVGKKQWIMFRPEKAFFMKQNAMEFFCYHESLEEERRDQLEFLTFTQNPGDMVFVPNEWGHAVLNMKPSIGVAVELFI